MPPSQLGLNIGYGDPENYADTEKIQQAAKLGGADDFIEALQHKYDTHIIRPVYDYSNDEPTGDSIFVGKKTDFSKFALNGTQKDFSGGQKQRIAL